MNIAGSGLLAVALLLAGAPVMAQASAADSAAFHELGRLFSAAYVRGDARAMADLYTADAVIFPERAEAISGPEAIRRYWTLPAGRRITHHKLTSTAIEVDGDHAYEHGTYEIAGENDGTAWGPNHGKYVVVWRREPVGWRMQLDIWNSRPPAKP
jgi:ketosteroid isomerase-like protein